MSEPNTQQSTNSANRTEPTVSVYLFEFWTDGRCTGGGMVVAPNADIAAGIAATMTAFSTVEIVTPASPVGAVA